MSAWAKPGVKCVCVVQPKLCFDVLGAGHPLSDYGIKAPVSNQILTIREVTYRRSGVGLLFVEIDNSAVPTAGGEEISFAVEKYRPLITRTQEQDIALFRHLLDRLPIGEDA